MIQKMAWRKKGILRRHTFMRPEIGPDYDPLKPTWDANVLGESTHPPKLAPRILGRRRNRMSWTKAPAFGFLSDKISSNLPLSPGCLALALMSRARLSNP